MATATALMYWRVTRMTNTSPADRGPAYRIGTEYTSSGETREAALAYARQCAPGWWEGVDLSPEPLGPDQHHRYCGIEWSNVI